MILVDVIPVGKGIGLGELKLHLVGYFLHGGVKEGAERRRGGWNCDWEELCNLSFYRCSWTNVESALMI